MGDTSMTRARILQAAEREFLDKGFQQASLRQIVREAGVTTGAFYRHYSTKEALFEALVKPHADHISALFAQAIACLEGLPREQQTTNMSRVSADYLDQMLDYIYDHCDRFKLRICSADGTLYQNFLHGLVELEVQSTYRYLAVLQSLGHPSLYIDRDLCPK